MYLHRCTARARIEASHACASCSRVMQLDKLMRARAHTYQLITRTRTCVKAHMRTYMHACIHAHTSQHTTPFPSPLSRHTCTHARTHAHPNKACMHEHGHHTASRAVQQAPFRLTGQKALPIHRARKWRWRSSLSPITFRALCRPHSTMTALAPVARLASFMSTMHCHT